MGEEVTKEGEHVADKSTSHQENKNLQFQNIFSLQYLLPHFSHLTSTSLMHFSHFRGVWNMSGKWDPFGSAGCWLIGSSPRHSCVTCGTSD